MHIAGELDTEAWYSKIIYMGVDCLHYYGTNLIVSNYSTISFSLVLGTGNQYLPSCMVKTNA